MPWRRRWQPIPVFLSGKTTEGPGGLQSMEVPKSQTQLSIHTHTPGSWAFGLGLITLALWVLLSTNHTSWIDVLVVACVCVCVCMLSCVWLFGTSMDCSPPGPSVVFPDKNTGMGCHLLLQGIFQTQGSNWHLLRLLHWQDDSSPLSHLGNPSSHLLVNKPRPREVGQLP